MTSRDTITTLSSLSSFYPPQAPTFIQNHPVDPLHALASIPGIMGQPYAFDFTLQQAAPPSYISSPASPTDEDSDLGSAPPNGAKSKPKRCCNSFFAYKMSMWKQHGGRPELQGYRQQILNTLWAALWEELLEDEKLFWRDEARRISQEHGTHFDARHPRSSKIRKATASKRRSRKPIPAAIYEVVKKLAKDVFGVDIKDESYDIQQKADRGGASTPHSSMLSVSATTSGGSVVSASSWGPGGDVPWGSHLGYQFPPVTCEPGNWQSLWQDQPQSNLNNLDTSQGANVAPGSYPHPGQNVSVEVGDFSMPNLDAFNWDFGTNHGLTSETFGHGMEPFPPLDFQGLQAVDGSGPWGSTMF